MNFVFDPDELSMNNHKQFVRVEQLFMKGS